MLNVSRKRMWVWFILAIAIVILVASGIVLFLSARLQQGLLNKTPSYDAATLYNQGVAAADKGDYVTAEQTLEQALSQQDDTTYRGELAVVKYRLKKYQESIDQYQQLISAGKDAAFAWNGTGNAYRDWADSDSTQTDALRAKAVDAYTKAIATNSQYVASYSNLGLLYEEENNIPQALAILDQGIKATGSGDLVTIRSRIAQK